MVRIAVHVYQGLVDHVTADGEVKVSLIDEDAANVGEQYFNDTVECDVITPEEMDTMMKLLAWHGKK